MKIVAVHLDDDQEEDLNVGKKNLIALLGIPKMSNGDYLKYLISKAKQA